MGVMETLSAQAAYRIVRYIFTDNLNPHSSNDENRSTCVTKFEDLINILPQAIKIILLYQLILGYYNGLDNRTLAYRMKDIAHDIRLGDLIRNAKILLKQTHNIRICKPIEDRSLCYCIEYPHILYDRACQIFNVLSAPLNINHLKHFTMYNYFGNYYLDSITESPYEYIYKYQNNCMAASAVTVSHIIMKPDP